MNQQDFQQPRRLEPDVHTFRLKSQPVILTPRDERIPIAACDTSTIKIGETRTGVLVAIRGASVRKQNGRYRYARLGPFIFHMTEENKNEVYHSLERAYCDLPHNLRPQCFPNVLQVSVHMASLLERWLQTMLVRTVDHGLVLFDGSLTAGIGDTSVHYMEEILAHASEKDSVVLAFSKTTNLRINGYLITDIPISRKAPYLLETAGLEPKPPIRLLGEVYVANLSHGRCAYRLDIDKENTSEKRIEAVEKLLGNDVFSQGYPETLRLAHILCTFTANEVIAMQHFALSKYGLKIIDRPDVHMLLFGPFGRGASHS